MRKKVAAATVRAARAEDSSARASRTVADHAAEIERLQAQLQRRDYETALLRTSNAALLKTSKMRAAALEERSGGGAGGSCRDEKRRGARQLGMDAWRGVTTADRPVDHVDRADDEEGDAGLVLKSPPGSDASGGGLSGEELRIQHAVCGDGGLAQRWDLGSCRAVTLTIISPSRKSSYKKSVLCSSATSRRRE